MAKDKAPVFTFGAILLVLGLLFLGMQLNSAWNGVETQGKVIAVHERSETDSTGTRTYYEPTIAFTTTAGDSARGVLRYNESAVRYRVGDQVEIVYQKSDPGELHAVHSAWWYLLSTGMLALGIYVLRVSLRLKSEGW